MSKTVKRKPVNVVGSEEEEEVESDAHDMAMEEAIKDFADGRNPVKLYRHPSELTGGAPRLLCALSPEEFNDVYVQERFGGGKYFGRWRTRNGGYTRFNFLIDGEPKVFTKKQEEEAAAQQQQERESRPYGFEGSQHEEGHSQQIGMGDILRIMSETRRDTREEIRTILEIAMKSNAPQPDVSEKVFSLVEKIVPLISQGGGDGSGGNPWLFALSQLKDPLMKMVDTIHQAVTQQKTVPGGAPAAATQPDGKRLTPPPVPEPIHAPTPAPVPEPKSEDDMLLDSFRPYLGMLGKAAEQGKDPGLYSDLILDQLPVFAYDRLRTWLNKPGCLDQLEAISPRPYTIDERAWFDTLRGLLLEALNEELGHAPRTVQPQPHSDPTGSGPTDSPLVS